MYLFSTLNRLTIFALALAIITACSNSPVKRATIADVDISGIIKKGENLAPKSSEDIRKAYANYLKYASKQDKSRVDALNRLAQIEFELSEQLLQDNNSDTIEALDDQLYNEKLNRTIELLNTSLNDYPNAKNNDETLYQLAKAYDQKGNYELTLATIEKLVNHYPKSKYYIEGQFRLAEAAFSSKKYTISEDKYTEIVGSKKNSVFYEKSLYKRGWSRFKQEFYLEAADDFLQVVKYNQFDDYSLLEAQSKSLFNEYFRAIGLSFSYLGGAEPLNEYFKQTKNFKHLYYTYSHVSDIYVKQERFSDAVNTLNYFTQHNPKSEFVPEALLKTISIWENSGFSSKMSKSLDLFYKNYHPNSQYWHNNIGKSPRLMELAKNSLRQHILTVTANYHKQFLSTKKIADFVNAQRWYRNYLKHYSSYSRQDNIHFLFGSLLAENNNTIEALKHFELSGFDSDIIINKDAAYETISLASQMLEASKNKKNISRWLKKLIHYSTLYSEQNPRDLRTRKIIINASELTYKNKMFNETIILADLFIEQKQTSTSNIKLIKAHSYFETAQYVDAENLYFSLLENKNLAFKNRASILKALALSIYYQGKSAADKNEINEAIHHYARIIRVIQKSPIAANGLYDAIALTIKTKQWAQSIGYIKTFRRLYPKHKLIRDVAKKLSVAYLNTKQDIAAAKELEQLSTHEEDKKYKLAALWKASEIYESKKDYISAIRSYEKYAKNFTSPYPQYMESLFKLVKLNTMRNNKNKINLWQNKIINSDKKTAAKLKTARTNFIASSAALQLGRKNNITFDKTKLILPLKRNLKKKKQAMQRAVNLYARASSYGIAETATQATHAIAELYNDFSTALLNSERPKNLNQDELEQYQILLEDQAFPFEEKAIEFYEINLIHVRDGVYDQWVIKSHNQLKELFPVRYQREPKLEGHINVLH